MGTTERKVKITIGAKDAASGVLKGVKVGMVGLAAAAAAATAAMAAIGVALVKVTRAAAAQEEAEIRLAQALKTIGQNTRSVRDDIRDFNSALQDQTTIDDQVILGVEQLLITLGKLEGEGLKRATQGALDLAAVLGREVTPIAQVLAKAADGDTRALKQFGIVVDETASKSEKWAQVLRQLEDIQGAAAAKGRTFSGAITRLGNDFGDLQEQIGFVIVKNQTFQGLLGAISGGIKEFGAQLKEQPQLLADMEFAITSLTLATAQLGVSALTSMESLTRAITRAPSFLEFLGDIPPDQENRDIFASFEAALIALVDRELDAEEETGSLAASLRILETITSSAEKRMAELREQFEFIGPPEAAAADAADALGEGLKRTADAAVDASARIEETGEALDQLFINLNEKLPEVPEALAEAVARMNEEFNSGFEEMTKWTDAMRQAIGQGLVNAARQFSDTLVDAAFGAKRGFDDFIKSALKGFAKMIAQLLVMKALSIAFPSFGKFFGFSGGGEVPEGQHGGFVRGGAFGRDSVLAALTPGEIVLPPPVASAFQDVVQAARDLGRSGRRGGAVALPDAGIQVFNRIEPRRDRLQDAIEFVEAQNELAERHGLRVVATELIE